VGQTAFHCWGCGGDSRGTQARSGNRPPFPQSRHSLARHLLGASAAGNRSVQVPPPQRGGRRRLGGGAEISLGWHEGFTSMNTSRLVAKQVGVSVKISLGKEYAGRTVLIESSEPGVWVIKTAYTIPDSELWLHQPEASARLDRALLAIIEPPNAADLDVLEQQLSCK